MSDLIVSDGFRVINGEEVNSVNLRDVHKFLESKQRFGNWATNRLGDLIEGVDFIGNKIITEYNQIDSIDYIVTFEAAKHICIIERNEKGKQLRNELFRIEKEYVKILEENQKLYLALESKTRQLESEQKLLQDERNELIKRLYKDTHNRISCLEKDENGIDVLTQKDRRLVSQQQKLQGRYIMNCCALSNTLHLMKIFCVDVPKNDIKLKDGRVLKTTFREPKKKKKITCVDIFNDFMQENGQFIFDFL